MAFRFYGHPFSSYCQKVQIALYENAVPFDYVVLDQDSTAELHRRWPLRRFPVVVTEDGRTLAESSVIIEWLALEHPGPVALIPADPRAALDVRMLDRCFDHYVQTPMQKIVADHMRKPEARDAQGVAEARALLETTYAWLEDTLADRAWAAGADFGLADCAAAPALFYSDWVQPIGTQHPRLRAYRQRLLARPSIARCVEEARPFRAWFPPGAPDRD